MSDFSTSNQSESIDTETGEIRYRKTLAKPVAAQRTSRGKIPSIHVENHITIPAKNTQHRVIFISLSPLGAHVIAMAKLTGRQYQVVFLLIRDMNFEGQNFTHPEFLAGELGMDVADVRRALKVLEDKNILYR